MYIIWTVYLWRLHASHFLTFIWILGSKYKPVCHSENVSKKMTIKTNTQDLPDYICQWKHSSTLTYICILQTETINMFKPIDEMNKRIHLKLAFGVNSMRQPVWTCTWLQYSSDLQALLLLFLWETKGLSRAINEICLERFQPC